MQLSKLLIFGGTFNPFHIGHYTILKQAQELVNPDKTIVVVNNISPHKLTHAPISGLDRLQMVRLALQNEKSIFVSDYEIQKKGPSYTYDTLVYFQQQYPHAEIYLLIGEDQWNNFSQWYHYEDILKLSKIIVAKRNFDNKESTSYSNAPLYIDGLSFPISSSELILQPKKYMLHPSVVNYINDHGLYAIDRIKLLMSDHRFKHSLRVATMCEQLMEKHDPSLKKLAFTAGIYHDIAKEMNFNDQIRIAEDILGIHNFVSPKVLHGYVGAHLLKTNYLFNNEMVLDAISRHTLPFNYYYDEPSLIAKILYLADKLEPNRTDEDVFGQDINTYRELAFNNIDLCFNKLYTWLQSNLSNKSNIK